MKIIHLIFLYLQSKSIHYITVITVGMSIPNCACIQTPVLPNKDSL